MLLGVLQHWLASVEGMKREGDLKGWGGVESASRTPENDWVYRVGEPCRGCPLD
jgi:hypothetical protein